MFLDSRLALSNSFNCYHFDFFSLFVSLHDEVNLLLLFVYVFFMRITVVGGLFNQLILELIIDN